MSDKDKKLAQLHILQKQHTTGRIINDSRDRLKKIAMKKFRTCFICAIVEFEKMFGNELWGHELRDDTVTEIQKANRTKWDKVRKQILDKGNTQSRALCLEIDLHKVEFEGYHIDFGGISNG